MSSLTLFAPNSLKRKFLFIWIEGFIFGALAVFAVWFVFFSKLPW